MEIKIFIFILSIGVAFVIFSLLNTAKEYETEKNSGIKTMAKVVGYEKSRSSKGNYSYYPIVQYKTLTGQNIESYQTYNLSRKKFKENSTITIIYQEKEPESFMIEGDSPASSFATFGIVCTLIMYVFLLYIIDTQFGDSSISNSIKSFLNL